MLIVHYEKLKQFDPIKKAWEGEKPFEVKKQADTLGWLMMSIGVYEITEKTVDELIFRTKFLDFVHGSSYFVGNPSDTDLRQLFKNHIGLKIEITNQGIQKECTRHKFMVRHLSTVVERIEKQMNN